MEGQAMGILEYVESAQNLPFSHFFDSHFWSSFVPEEVSLGGSDLNEFVSQVRQSGSQPHPRSLRDCITKALGKIRQFSLLRNRYRIRVPLRRWFLFGFPSLLRRRRCGGFWAFIGEEVFEDSLSLPPGRVLEVDPDVHPSRSAQGWVQAPHVIGGREQ